MEQQKPAATIVIPCYNGAAYLGRCLDSAVLQEGAKDGRVEVIVVDDGSTDQSLDIARRYAGHIPFLRVISQENRGAAAARNAGIDAAGGQYVLFLDSDDWLERDAIALLLQAVADTGAQVVHYLLQYERLGQSTVVENGVQSKTLMDKEAIRAQAMPLMLGGTRLNSSCVNFYSLAFLRENGIRFEEGRRMGEDARFVWRVLNKAESLYFINRPLYHYFYHTSSTVHCVTREHIRDALGFQKHLRDSLAEYRLDTPQNNKLARQGVIAMGLDLIAKTSGRESAMELLEDQSVWEAWEKDGYRPKGALACWIAQNACEGRTKQAYWAAKAYAWHRRWLRVWGKDTFLRVKGAILRSIADVKRSVCPRISPKAPEQ